MKKLAIILIVFLIASAILTAKNFYCNSEDKLPPAEQEEPGTPNLEELEKEFNEAESAYLKAYDAWFKDKTKDKELNEAEKKRDAAKKKFQDAGGVIPGEIITEPLPRWGQKELELNELKPIEETSKAKKSEEEEFLTIPIDIEKELERYGRLPGFKKQVREIEDEIKKRKAAEEAAKKAAEAARKIIEAMKKALDAQMAALTAPTESRWYLGIIETKKEGLVAIQKIYGKLGESFGREGLATMNVEQFKGAVDTFVKEDPSLRPGREVIDTIIHYEQLRAADPATIAIQQGANLGNINLRDLQTEGMKPGEEIHMGPGPWGGKQEQPVKTKDHIDNW